MSYIIYGNGFVSNKLISQAKYHEINIETLGGGELVVSGIKKALVSKVIKWMDKNILHPCTEDIYEELADGTIHFVGKLPDSKPEPMSFRGWTMDKDSAEDFKKFLRREGLYFEPSGCYNDIHIEVKGTFSELENVETWIIRYFDL